MAESQAIKANGLVFVSGQMAADNKGKLIEGAVAEKTHKICQNAQLSGYFREDILTVQQVYFANLDDFKEMNDVYALYFPHKPARSAIEAKRLPAGCSIEMDLIALA
ncbi:hypothetical protein SLS56_000305 [Neofusicoccum ribis]|uniref:Uncharacterized protein n=1 Tax=Neofusicoccum ribis TaxID=45134 RepID=A0ABR3TFZ8_9PEZI